SLIACRMPASSLYAGMTSDSRPCGAIWGSAMTDALLRPGGGGSHKAGQGVKVRQTPTRSASEERRSGLAGASGWCALRTCLVCQRGARYIRFLLLSHGGGGGSDDDFFVGAPETKGARVGPGTRGCTRGRGGGLVGPRCPATTGRRPPAADDRDTPR